MNHPHPLGVLAPSQAALESVDPRFVARGLLRARQKTIEAFDTIRGRLTLGMTEDDARRLALSTLKELGASTQWHKPYIRFGAGTVLTFHEPLQPDYRLQSGDPVYIDLGPVWPELEKSDQPLQYEGDYGDTFVMGANPDAEKCAAAARLLFGEAAEHWKTGKKSGLEIYAFLKLRATELGYRLLENVEGHRLSDFPHHRFSKEHLATVPFYPSSGLWILEVLIVDPALRFGAFFEDLLQSSSSN